MNEQIWSNYSNHFAKIEKELDKDYNTIVV